MIPPSVSRRLRPTSVMALLLMLNAHTAGAQAVGPTAPGIESRFASVNGTRLHYLIAGRGPAVVLLHGFGETSHMWRPLMAQLATNHLVIAPDLRGAGGSAKPAGGYDKKTLAEDVHALALSLGERKVTVVGHDIGLMVAYAYAAQYPAEVDRIALMDAFLPGVGDWTKVWLLRDLWHFHFYGETPLRLVRGRERIYLEHFWNDFAADRNHSLSESDRRRYAQAFAQPGAIEAGFGYFKAFEQDAKDFQGFASTKLTMPMLVLSGEKASGQFLIDQGRLVDTDVQGVIIKGSGHWLMEEAPEQTIPALVAFVNEVGAQDHSTDTRLTPVELERLPRTGPSAGTSGVAGIETTVVSGAPDKSGLYTILLHVPAHTEIAAHVHPDDRIATVLEGTWYFGYGSRFDASALKALPAGSVYAEPPEVAHFARTGDSAVVVQITGYGPTGTRYVDPKEAP